MLAYDDIQQLNANVPTVIVDMLETIKYWLPCTNILENKMLIKVGLTHWKRPIRMWHQQQTQQVFFARQRILKNGFKDEGPARFR